MRITCHQEPSIPSLHSPTWYCLDTGRGAFRDADIVCFACLFVVYMSGFNKKKELALILGRIELPSSQLKGDTLIQLS